MWQFAPEEAVMTLDELSDSDPQKYNELHTRIVQAAEQWCKREFRQDWVQIWEVGDVPIAYPDNILGYIVVVEMTDYPQRKRIEVLISPDDLITVREAFLF